MVIASINLRVGKRAAVNTPAVKECPPTRRSVLTPLAVEPSNVNENAAARQEPGPEVLRNDDRPRAVAGEEAQGVQNHLYAHVHGFLVPNRRDHHQNLLPEICPLAPSNRS